MTRVRLQINVLLVALSASYLTLGLANEDRAARLWWAYALTSGLLAATNLWLAHRGN